METSKMPLPRTNYLNGLRGLCAVLVVIHHHEQWAHSDYNSALLERAYGYNDHKVIATLPVVRTLFSGGHFAVAIFLVISGFVLSAQPLHLIKARQHDQLVSHLASAIFRRWVRLIAPVACVSWIHLTVWYYAPIEIPGTEREPTYLAELGRFCQQMAQFAWVFAPNDGPSNYGPAFAYNLHVWTIPLEIRGSMMVYVVLLALSRFPTRTRLLSQVVLIAYLLYAIDGWYGAMFLAGMLICDVQSSFGSQHPASLRWVRRSPGIRSLFVSCMLVAGMYLAGVPHVANKEILARNPGWFYLSALTPSAVLDQKWFFLLWAAVLIVWFAPQSSTLRCLLESRAFRDLGEMSYGLYLVHGPILWSLGNATYAYFRRSGSYGQYPPGMASEDTTGSGPILTEENGGSLVGLETWFLIPMVILISATFLLAKVFTIAIDKPSQRFAKWLYYRCCSLE